MLDQVVDPEELDVAVRDGLVRLARHPRLPLTIANYTAKAQWERRWTPVTRRCRGLVFADDGSLVARPFEKFFNYGDVVLPRVAATMPPLVTTKVDGSLGILVRWDGEWSVATRGSFTSEQSEVATRWLGSHVGDLVGHLASRPSSRSEIEAAARETVTAFRPMSRAVTRPPSSPGRPAPRSRSACSTASHTVT